MGRQQNISSWLAGVLLATTAGANVVGSDTQNFNPAAHRSDYVTVESTGVLTPGRFSLGLFANTAINSLPYEDGDGQTRARVNDTLTSLDAVAAAGLLPRLELGLALPFVAHQSVRDDETRGEFDERGNTGTRVSLKWSLVARDGFGLALVGGAMIGRTEQDPYAGDGASPIYVAQIASDFRLGGGVRLGANLGYRFREPGEDVDGALVEPMRNQMLASAGVRVPLAPGVSAIGELYGSRPTGEPDEQTDRSTANAETLAGVRWDVRKDLYVHGGAGSELMRGLSTPDWRLYAGLVTELGVKDEPARPRIVRKKSKPKAPVVPVSYEEESYPEIPESEPDEVFVLHNINFEFDSDHRVLPGAFNELDKLARYLATRPYSKIIVEGHTDYMGTDEYNDSLSRRRAGAVRRRLIKVHGLDASRIVPVGYGEQRPMTNDTSDAGRQLNRRVELKIYRD